MPITRVRFRHPLTFLLTLCAVAPLPAADESALDQLFETGKQLFDQYAPAEIKEQYEFPSKEHWDEFAAKLQVALESNNLAELAAYETDARNALTALRMFPGYEDYADWLQERIGYMEVARELEAEAAAPSPPSTTPTPSTPPTPTTRPPTVRPPKPVAQTPAIVRTSAAAIPNYDLWLKRMEARPAPSAAANLMPRLRAVFAAEGIPAELAWIAETESTLNPAARSPVGAKGLFQLMPETAKSLGLSVFLPDERVHVEKSAQAAARYLRTLHGKFGDWPLALAAYNAGEGRVRRLMKASGGKNFAQIAASLPSETRMYVPKVCATIAVRAGVPPEKLAAPRAG